jgi:hypothetical protein
MTDESKKTELKLVSEGGEAVSIQKPTEEFSLDRFKSKHGATLANVETLLTALPHGSISQAKDFVRLHPDEEKYWSPELCFVNVPVKGQKRDTLHLIDEELAMRFLPSARILRFRLALASKPNDAFFLCEVPSQNLDNSWNSSNLDACQQAKSFWIQATSRRDEGVDGYKVDFARDADAFAPPQWPKQSLNQIIGATFNGNLTILSETHAGLLRLIGAKLTP